MLSEQLAQQPAAPDADDDTFWALKGLRARTPDPGAVMMVGSVHTPNGVEASWQLAALTEQLFDADFADHAEPISRASVRRFTRW